MGLRGTAIAAAALGAALGVAGWAVSDHLEQDDAFCNACHVSVGMPLHREIRRDYDARPARSLAGAHAVARPARRADGAMRCIDCHGGSSLLGRARVKALAAKDAFFYTVGSFAEPRSMRWPLWDEDCRKCHASFAARSDASGGSPGFHELAVHNVALGIGCVECHRAHATRVDRPAHFLDIQAVRAQCARCHSEFAQGG